MTLTIALLATLLSADPQPETLGQRFQRAVRLFDAGDANAALREFETIQHAKATPAVLFNIAFCRAKLEDPVGAVAALDELLAHPGSLEAARLSKASALRDEQSHRVVPLELSLPADAPEPVAVEIDGVSHLVRRGEKLPLNPGRHQVTVLAPGNLPWRQLVDAAAGQPLQPSVELVKSERKPALVRLSSKQLEVHVALDGKPAGVTPIQTALAIAPGDHELAFTRDGYLPRTESLTLGEGAHESLDVALEPDPKALPGTLALQVSETNAVVTVDSNPLGDRSTLSLPQGPHQLRVERDGYFPAEREVKLTPGGAQELLVVLEPLPSTLSQLERRASQHRFWGWLGVGVGAAAVIAGLTTFGINYPNLQKTYRDLDAAQSACMASPGSSACDPIGQLAPQATLQEQYQLTGLIIAGVGAAAAAAGAISLYSSPDLERYHHSDADLAPAGVELGAGPGGVSLSGRF